MLQKTIFFILSIEGVIYIEVGSEFQIGITRTAKKCLRTFFSYCNGKSERMTPMNNFDYLVGRKNLKIWIIAEDPWTILK